jgi:DGQHR domain-containing protein
MFNEVKLHEVETMVKNKRNTDLKVDRFATISGIRGKQFGREVFSTVLKFKDIKEFLDTFPEVQRQLLPHKVASIKMYVLSGLKQDPAMRFFPALTCTARGHCFYDEATNRLAVDVRNSKLSLNDGQHRWAGVNAAINDLMNRIDRESDKEKKFILRSELKELEEMVIPLTIFNNLTEEEEKQLFYDTNSLAQRPSRSTTIRLAQTDVWSKLSRDVSKENRYLSYYGVEMEKNSIGDSNPNTVLLTTVYELVRRINWDRSLPTSKHPLTDENYEMVKVFTNATIDTLFYHLPNDLKVKGKYLIEKNFVLKAIGKFIYDCRVLEVEDKIIFDTIGSVKWENDITYWKEYGGVLSKRGAISFGASGTQSISAIYDCLMEHLPQDE